MDTLQIERLKQSQKSILVAYLLWWFFGIFGGHRFYMGKKHAVTMLVITIIGFLTAVLIVGWFLLLAMCIMAIIDAFKIPNWVKEYNLKVIEDFEASEKAEKAPEEKEDE